MVATSGTETSYPSGAPEFTPQVLVGYNCVVFYRLLFVLCGHCTQSSLIYLF
jgi:hypothetical protein